MAYRFWVSEMPLTETNGVVLLSTMVNQRLLAESTTCRRRQRADGAHGPVQPSVNYPTLLALTRSLRVGLPVSATHFFTDARHGPTVRTGSAVSAGVNSE